MPERDSSSDRPPETDLGRLIEKILKDSSSHPTEFLRELRGINEARSRLDAGEIRRRITNLLLLHTDVSPEVRAEFFATIRSLATDLDNAFMPSDPSQSVAILLDQRRTKDARWNAISTLSVHAGMTWSYEDAIAALRLIEVQDEIFPEAQEELELLIARKDTADLTAGEQWQDLVDIALARRTQPDAMREAALLHIRNGVIDGKPELLSDTILLQVQPLTKDPHEGVQHTTEKIILYAKSRLSREEE